MSEITLEKCPCCGSEVDWMTSRDLHVGSVYIQCKNEECKLCNEESPFYAEYICFQEFEDRYPLVESVCERWNLWCKTNPKQYRDAFWD